MANEKSWVSKNFDFAGPRIFRLRFAAGSFLTGGYTPGIPGMLVITPTWASKISKHRNDQINRYQIVLIAGPMREFLVSRNGDTCRSYRSRDVFGDDNYIAIRIEKFVYLFKFPYKS
jgi:hypothetical protein